MIEEKRVLSVLPIDQIVPDERNRTIEEDEDLEALVDSIRVFGVLQPLHVQSLGENKYRLVDGERRWRAAQKGGLKKIPCEIWEPSKAQDAAIAGVVLNEQRKAHSPIHVARRLR